MMLKYIINFWYLYYLDCQYNTWTVIDLFVVNEMLLNWRKNSSNHYRIRVNENKNIM